MKIEEQIKILDTLLDALSNISCSPDFYNTGLNFYLKDGDIDDGCELLEYLKSKKEDGKG